MNDSDIIELFFERSEEAIMELSKKYGRLCLSIAKNITNNEQDAQECVNDTYMATWETIPPNRPNPLMSYVCRLTRNISVNRYKFNSRKKRNSNYEVCLDELENCLFDSGGLDENIDDSDIAKIIDEFLKSLSDTDRMIFVRRFWYFDTYEKISELAGIKEGAVRMRVSRSKGKLKECLLKKGVII